MQRHFCFLQGNASDFYRALAQALHDDGHRVSRINICGGDQLFWGDWNAVDYKGRPQDFSDFAESYALSEMVTDLILHNDCRASHAGPIQRLKPKGINAWIFEEGYLRPHWLTLEKGGINGFSPLTREPERIRQLACDLGDEDTYVPVGAGAKGRVLSDFRWQWANYQKLWRYPHYRTHRPYPIWAEYMTWIGRLAILKQRQRKARRIVSQLADGEQSYFVFALQLDTDSQIRVHSDFKRMPPAISHVIENFHRHAPEQATLVIKNHPLDNGWINYARLIRRQAKSLGISERVIFIDGGDLSELIRHSQGVITVNSTVGFTALDMNQRVICLGRAIFDLPGLTFQGELKDFWRNQEYPDQPLYRDFKKVVMHQCLINGNFYTEEGITCAVANSMKRILAAD